jgi:hypothetical protein|tara:strand:+ start:400 stop:918 length:519 start_codon:yes stop_codon:yes gene_type:complete
MDGIDVDRLIRNYLVKMKYDKQRYAEMKDDAEFKAKNCARSKQWYEDNRQKRIDYYDKHKEFKKAYQQYNYYHKKGRLVEFCQMYPEKCHLLIERRPKIVECVTNLTEVLDKLDAEMDEDFVYAQVDLLEQSEDEEDYAEDYNEVNQETGEVNPNFIYDDIIDDGVPNHATQ